MVADQTHRAPCVKQHALCMREMCMFPAQERHAWVSGAIHISTKVAVPKLQNTLEE